MKYKYLTVCSSLQRYITIRSNGVDYVWTVYFDQKRKSRTFILNSNNTFIKSAYTSVYLAVQNTAA